MNKVPTRRPVHCHCRLQLQANISANVHQCYSRHFYHTALVHSLLGAQLLHRSLQLWLGSLDDWRVSYSSGWPMGHPEIFQESISGIWDSLFPRPCPVLVPLWLAETSFPLHSPVEPLPEEINWGGCVTATQQKRDIASFWIAPHWVQWFRKDLLLCSYFAIAPLCSSPLFKWVNCVASELPHILNLCPKSSLRKWLGVSIQK